MTHQPSPAAIEAARKFVEHYDCEARVADLAAAFEEYARSRMSFAAWAADEPVSGHFAKPPGERLEDARKLNEQTAKWIHRVKPMPLHQEDGDA